MLSITEENYIKCIFKLAEQGMSKVSTNAISSSIKASAASVTDMIKRLSEKGLVDYEKYRGVALSEKGKKKATQLIRNHRLWEVFLVEKLHFNWNEVHDIAEELEHIKSLELVDRLDQYLNYPKFDPHGDPIPNATGKFTIRQQFPLNKATKHSNVVVLGVQEHSTDFLNYLNQMNIGIGTSITIQEIFPFDGSMSVLINNVSAQHLTQAVSQKLLVNEI